MQLWDILAKALGEVAMSLNLTLPKSVELYVGVPGNQGFLTTSWIEAAKGSVTEMRQIGVFKLKGHEVLALTVSYQENVFYILAADLDEDAETLCRLWEHRRRNANPLVGEVEEMIAVAVRRYTRARLGLVAG
ncbi:MAG: hypothetical protein WC050_01605 [Candidatus Paceibacterota bacterium]